MQTISITVTNDWPDALIEYLEDNLELFVSWEFRGTELAVRKVAPSEYDAAIYGLRDVLNKYSLHGYHCTRLTDEEIRKIEKDGMSLQNKKTLSVRIDILIQERTIPISIGQRLKNENQADDANRARMLWFCFFEPHKAGQSGIGRFFKSWGGEALYNSHEYDPATGELLQTIGTPCIIEAYVPISILNKYSFLESKIVGCYLREKGHDISECLDHEDYAMKGLEAQLIKGVIKYPEEEFIRLTKCDEWDEFNPR